MAGACPITMTRVVVNGRVQSWPRFCNSWACPRIGGCVERRIEQTVKRVEDKNGPADVYVAELSAEHYASAKRQAQRADVEHGVLVRKSGTYIVFAAGQLQARRKKGERKSAWALTQMPIDELEDWLLDRTPYTKSSWSAKWRPPKVRVENPDTLYAFPAGPRGATEIKANAGVDEASGRIPGLGPDETAAGLKAARDEYRSFWRDQKKRRKKAKKRKRGT
jgi:hypothetical protein